MSKEQLAFFGGKPTVTDETVPEELFHWPIRTVEEDEAVLEVLHANKMSGNDITGRFEEEFAAWNGRRYAVACANGTMSLQAAMFAVGLGAGDELICPTITYWATCLSAQTLGVSIVFANVRPDTVCIDPEDLERCLSPRTKAIMVVHYWGHPCDMDAIMAFAKKHGLKVIEDVSHAQGGLYHGRKLGTFGDVAAMSLMSHKSFSCGELGILIADDKAAYDRAVAYLHYERNNEAHITTPELLPYGHLPLGGMKGRANQMCTTIGRVQLRYYDARVKELRRGINYFWDRMDHLPGVHELRVDEATGSNMAGWYVPHFLYDAAELGGLKLETFVAAVEAETGKHYHIGTNNPLHTHPVFNTFDPIGLGRPARVAYADRDVRELDAALARSEHIPCAEIPYFRAYCPEAIDRYVEAYRAVVAHRDELLAWEKTHTGPIHDTEWGQWYGQIQ